MTSHVYVIKGTDPAAMAHEAISKAFKENAAGKSVLLKVNTGFKGPAASGRCTHPEVVRGLFVSSKRSMWEGCTWGTAP